jgi:hypothetical protein
MLDRLRLRRTSASAHVTVPSRLTVPIAIAVTLVVGLVAAGCGSSSKSTASTATTPALSKPQFLAQGNAICRQGNQRLAAAQDKAFGHNQPSQAQITAYVTNAFAPNIQSQISAIRALGAPPGDQATVTTMLDVAQADLNRVKSDPALLAGNSPPFADFAKLAHPYGLTACAAKN